MSDEQASSAPGYERDIKPLFREKDRNSMLRWFDLWSYEDVVENQTAIAERVRAGSMPCDGQWSLDQVASFDEWVAGGGQP